jgi:hypothetical protein
MKRIPIALASLLLLPALPALTVNAPQGLAWGNTVDLQTDQSSGTYTVLAPTQSGSCHTAIATGTVPGDGRIPGVHLDRAGPWQLRVQGPTGAQNISFMVEPDGGGATGPARTLRILATPVNTAQAGVMDYDVQISRGGQAVQAYADLYFGAQFLRHYSTDELGHLRIPHTALPYVGSYQVRAYKDLDPPTTPYPYAFQFQDSPPCDPANPYDAPELYNVGPEQNAQSASIEHLEQPLVIQVLRGPIQVRHVAGLTVLQALGPAGIPVDPTQLTILAAGHAASPAALGLAVSSANGTINVNGTWDTPGDLAVLATVDLNGDGVAELQGQQTIAVQDSFPIRLEPLGGNLTYSVPPRQGDGRPGTATLRFRLLDADDHPGRPPELPQGNVGVTGDILGTSHAYYDAANDDWVIVATPKNSDSTYQIHADWPGVGNLTAVIHNPPEGGAKSTPLSAPLVANVEGAIQVRVERYNPNAALQGGCTPAPQCAYETVTDARVELFWADTGQEVRAPTGAPYIYDPAQPQNACDCFELNGVYHFLNVRATRSGPMAAHAVVGANGGAQAIQYHTYASLPVQPRPLLLPEFTPSASLAGQFTVYHLAAANYTSATYQDYDTRILNEQGHDVTERGSLSAADGHVLWATALPAGTYRLQLTQRLDPSRGLCGCIGTQTMGTLQVLPAAIHYAYTDSRFDPQRSQVGDLRQSRLESYVLGAGFGNITQLSIAVTQPDGLPATGYLTLHAETDGHAFALLAPSADGEPVKLGDPQLFPPGQPAYVAGKGQSYYIVELNRPQAFQADLTLRLLGAPVRIYAWGTGTGNVTATFRPATSNQDSEQPATGILHIVPPQARVHAITTRAGQARSPALAVGEPNVVQVDVQDPVGQQSLDGIQVGLTRVFLGPTQAPTATATITSGVTRAVIGIVPDATGAMLVVAAKGPSITPTASCIARSVACGNPGAPLRLAVLPGAQIDYGAGSQVVVSTPTRIVGGSIFQVRATAPEDPFPPGTVRVFNRTFDLIQGAVDIEAPRVEHATGFLLNVTLAGHAPVLRMLTVDIAPNAPPTPPPGSPPPLNDTAPEAPPVPPPSSTPTRPPSTTTSAPNRTDPPPVAPAGGLADFLADNPTVAVLVLGGIAAAIFLGVRRFKRGSTEKVAPEPAPEEPESYRPDDTEASPGEAGEAAEAAKPGEPPTPHFTRLTHGDETDLTDLPELPGEEPKPRKEEPGGGGA